MVKIVLAILIVLFGSFCGFILTKKYRKKRQFYMQLNDFNERFLNEIAYYRRPIFEFASKYPFKGEFLSLLNDYLDKLRKGEYSIGLVFSNLDIDFLSKEEKTEIDNYFQMLGKGDATSQKTFFSSEKEHIKTRLKNAEECYKKYGNLYIKLGFLCGIFIVILII